MIRHLFVLLVCFFAVSVVSGKFNDPFRDTTNPVIRGDFADPSVIRVGDKYYAAGTSSEWAPHYPIYVSTDLVNWKQVGHIFPVKEAWMQSSFWAPELYWLNNKVYAYYTVRDTNGISCIGVATAEDPEKKFTDHGVLIRTGKEAIDAFVFNDSGQLYITWKAYGLDKRPIELLSSKLSADGLKLTGEPVSIKKDDAGKGLEGQSMIRRNGYYYLFYSAGSCCGVPCDYNVKVSRSKSVTGPFQDFEGNPVLKAGGQWMCTGHGTPVQAADKRWFYLFHAYDTSSNVFTGRQALLTEMIWNDKTGWPSFKQPGKSATRKFEWKDEFDKKDLSLSWSWDFRNSDINAKTENGKLVLSGKIISKTKKSIGTNDGSTGTNDGSTGANDVSTGTNNGSTGANDVSTGTNDASTGANDGSTGTNDRSTAMNERSTVMNQRSTAICVRTVTPDYEISTEISNVNMALKGLVLYGDQESNAGIGVIGDSLIVWTRKNDKTEILKTIKLVTPKSIRLKMVVAYGRFLRFFYANTDNKWLPVPLGVKGVESIDVSYTRQWDRAPRPGLIHQGQQSEPAIFEWCKISSN